MKVAVIDLDSVAYSIGNGNKVLNPDGTPLRIDNKFVYTDKSEEELRSSADFYMKQIMLSGGFTHYIAYIKGQDTTNRRLAVNPDYKGNRSNIPPTWWGFVCNDLFNRWNAHYVNNMEVDDMVNITRLKTPDSHIVAIDKDLLSLEGKHFNWRTCQWIQNTKLDEDIKFWTDMIVGQVGDNIKGLKGKGPAYVKKLFSSEFFEVESRTFAEIVLKVYIDNLGEFEGISQFHMNYVCLKILEDAQVTIPQVTPFTV